MLNKIAKLSLVATSLAPICLTLWFIEICKIWDEKATFLSNISNHWLAGFNYFLIAFLLTLVCWGLIALSKQQLEKIPVQINAVKTVDKEIVGLLKGISIVAKKLGISLDMGKGYRTLSNLSEDGGQEVPHLHFHLYGGERIGKMVQ